jgi:hypothetical protein
MMPQEGIRVKMDAANPRHWYYFGTPDERAAADLHRIPLSLAKLSFNVWERKTPEVLADFASREDYVAYRAAKHHAERERRALRRAIETNPFTLPQAIATAETLGAAVDALPVGKDIRVRLRAHLDAHIVTLRALIDEPRGAR